MFYSLLFFFRLALMKNNLELEARLIAKPKVGGSELIRTEYRSSKIERSPDGIESRKQLP